MASFVDDNGLLRFKRRIENCQLSFNEKFPIILIDKTIVRDMLKEIHINLFHGGIFRTIEEIKKNFYIPKLYFLVKNLIAHCQKCQRFKEKAYGFESPPLPKARMLIPKRAFCNIGIDLFINREMKEMKIFSMIFVCANSRAVHLDVVQNKGIESLGISENFGRLGNYLTELKNFGSKNGITPRIGDLALKNDQRRQDWPIVEILELNKTGKTAKILDISNGKLIVVQFPLAYSNIGQHKCLDIVFCRFYWPKWRNDVKQWIRKCVCNVKKDNDPHPANQPMSATDIVNLNPFEKVAIDIMTLSSSESGNRYIFVPVVRLNYIFLNCDLIYRYFGICCCNFPHNE
ncbi:hypothetical protein DERF_009136 [Dermatophagoides farinae]|uniref:Integrase zinc-binding domain-containing protein n=1 Tax=Dermatophagoides farinae TaxID=6954 RepID=A0A922HYH3_DERFA|nr:hypothetical protein DERF_009136 [Dermatophagoides farinae]